MTFMTGYDHHKKAGNQGDIVKHPALMAAVDAILDSRSQPVFRYVDTFAGYAWNPLVKGHEWPSGLGKIGGKPGLGSNKDVALWAELYGLNAPLRSVNVTPDRRGLSSISVVNDKFPSK